MTHCLFCHQPFPANRTLERFVCGRRVAYDPLRGRLWAVCAACGRWTLAPFDSRWEVLEDLERLTRDRARLLGETGEIALLVAEDLEIVRVGKAGLREESWWRFGREFSARRTSAQRTVRHGRMREALFSLLLAGMPLWGFNAPSHWIGRARTRQFGNIAWQGESGCDGCGASLGAVPFEERDRLLLRPGDAGEAAFWYACARCAGEGDAEAGEHGHRITGVAAEHLLRRLLAHANFTGGTAATVGQAMDLVESHATVDDVIRRLCLPGTGVGALTQTRAFALEIAVSAEAERRLLQLELDALKSRWREEEEIAAIADGILTPRPRRLES